MRRRLSSCFAVIGLAVSAMAQQQAQPPTPSQPQSATDAAHNSRPQPKKPAKVWDNDNLPVEAPVTVMGEPRPDTPATPGEVAPDNGVLDKKAAPAATPMQDAKADDWKLQVAEQKKNISLLERELNVMQREYRLRVASYYADAGNGLRDPKKWAEDNRNYQQQMEQKNADLAAARERLEETRERARKAGVPLASLQ